MSTTTISDAAQHYLDEVRGGLAGLLPEEEAEEVLQDLEAHLAEVDEDEIEATLGTPSEFLAEFTSSAGLDAAASGEGGWLEEQWRRGFAGVRNATALVRRSAEPIVAPLMNRRDDIRTAWVWSRGILAIVAFAWAGYSEFGSQHILVPQDAGLLVQVGVLALATFASVRLAAAEGTWWKRLDVAASLGVAILLLSAVTTARYVPYPEEQGFVWQADISDAGYPALLIGPNGPIQNLYAYDVDGNPIEVLVYDEYGNPILTLPEYAYEEAVLMPAGEPFIWEGFEIRFQQDIYDRPIGNLYPLQRYEWTETGARSAPQPPPVVGVPSLPTEVPSADEPASSTEPSSSTRPTTTEPTTTETAPTTTVPTTTAPPADLDGPVPIASG